MKTRVKKYPLIAAAFLGLLPSLHAATLLAIDFGNGAAQSGFTAWNPTPSDAVGIKTTTFSTSVGTVTATIGGGATAADLVTANPNYSTNTRDRGGPAAAGTFTNTALLSDRIVATLVTNGTPSPNAGLLLQLGGLSPNTTYVIQLWGYEQNNISTAKFVDFYNLGSGTDVLLGGYTTTPGQTPLTNDDFSLTTTVTTDATGTLILKSRSNYDGVGILNGLRISDIPEPASSSLALLAAATLAGRRRRA